MASPSKRMMKMVSSASPPRVSATTGMKSTPAERQAERCDVSLRRTPTCRAWPGVEASCKVSCCRGESRGHPMLQGSHGSRWGGVCLPAWSGSRGPDWELLLLGPRPQTGQLRTGRRVWHCVEQSCPHCLRNQPGGLHRHQPCCDTQGRSSWCCVGALPASTSSSI